MENAEQGVKDGATPANVTADEKGVPWENRAKEMERKHGEAIKRIQELEARVSQPATEPAAEEVAEAKKQKIAEFVEDPDAYIDRKVQEREFKRRLPEAISWLKSQSGFGEGDDVVVDRVIHENGLVHPDPMLRAKAAWGILKAERLEREFSEGQRRDRISSSMPEGSGRSVQKQDAPKRADLISQLKTAQKQGDHQGTLRLLSQLEDVRE